MIDESCQSHFNEALPSMILSLTHPGREPLQTVVTEITEVAKRC